MIIGLVKPTNERPEPREKRLFSYDDINGDPAESRHASLTAYLFDAGAVNDRHLVVREASRPLRDVPAMLSGTQPIDDGNYILSAEERLGLLRDEPAAEQFLCPYVGSREYINGIERWILALQNASPAELRALPTVRQRMQRVREFRSARSRVGTLAIADYPTRYNVEVIPDRPFLVVPKTSSERREYVPVGWLQPPTIPSDLVFALLDADLWHFGVLTSRTHMAWLRHIGGRLKSDYRYSIGLVYNAFPWPEASEAQRQRVRALAQAVLDARALFPGSTLADLYDADVMRPELRRAHRQLDAAVDRLYRSAAFSGDRERVEHLFGLYESSVAPLTAVAPRRATRRKRAAA